MRKDIIRLKKIYSARRPAIKKRIAEFRRKLFAPAEEVFYELCFCLLTPQSRAKICWRAVEKLIDAKLLPPKLDKSQNLLTAEIERHLKGVRFPKNKSRYIALAINRHYKDICSSESERCVKKLKNYSLPEILGYRDFLVANIKGYGYKEASHFLRNVGLGKDIAILDRHILKNLLEHGAVKKIPTALNKKNYLEIENKMREFSKKIKIPLEELDLLFWSMEAGEIFK